MKIFAFVDVHDNKKAMDEIRSKVEMHNPDIIINAGVISIFENNIEILVEFLAKLKKPVLNLHGNHETYEMLFMLCGLHNNLICFHCDTHRIGNYLFLGHGGGGFSRYDTEFERVSKKFRKEIKEDDKVILITHGPPFRTNLDKVGKDHVGNKSYRKFIESNKVDLAISGHIHETAGASDVIGRTKLLNPGPFGKLIIL